MIRPPIIIDARGDLLVFHSLAAVQRELTPADVRDGHYSAAYDAEGRGLRIEVKTQERKILGLFPEVKEWVEVTPTEHIPTHEQTLREFLLRFIHPNPSASSTDSCPPAEGILRFAPAARS
jgi:hypothetical protein